MLVKIAICPQTFPEIKKNPYIRTIEIDDRLSGQI